MIYYSQEVLEPHLNCWISYLDFQGIVGSNTLTWVSGNDGELRWTVNPLLRLRGFESLLTHQLLSILYNGSTPSLQVGGGGSIPSCSTMLNHTQCQILEVRDMVFSILPPDTDKWGVSSSGRTLHLHCKGERFESATLHQ